ncbi:fibro-slime domain-containing protein [Lentilactobacillus curieae]|uniref:Fibro-slime domain-containing protein n=1 Tax=Lentilactobacillus curieae TaxID=1138822 RepID=A0A1S6QGP7_9LACO|nr:fibro-slime domain-containing protein [Lentilactobacillus curieae]AQW20778.1 fibro-slime domain-containing protein [Lentilactobacillus curieae]
MATILEYIEYKYSNINESIPDGYSVKNFYERDDKLYEYSDGSFKEVNDKQLLKFFKDVKNKGYVTSGYLNDDSQEIDEKDLLAKAIEAGQDYVQIGNKIYHIDYTSDPDDIHDKGIIYSITVPKVMPKTDLKNSGEDNKTLKELESINPGVKISLFDYWLKDDGTEKGGNVNDLGINNGKYLKFSAERAGLTNPNPNNVYKDYAISQEIVRDYLDENGYPIYKSLIDQSLAYLFDDSQVEGKKVVFKDQDGENLFVSDGNGGFSYDSKKNHAYLDENGDIKLFNWNNMPGAKTGKPERFGQFFPLDRLDEFFEFQNGVGVKTKQYKTGSVNSNAENGLNHYFGMTMEMGYIHPKDGEVESVKDGAKVKTPMKFEFSGDDDFWLFIDNKLALDIGGIHDAASGSIDFSTGVVTAQVKTGQPEAVVGQIVSSETETVPKNVKKIVIPNWNKADSEHQIKLFYLERGHEESNLKMNFNLQIPQHNYAENNAFAVDDKNPSKKVAYAVGSTYSERETTRHTYGTYTELGIRETNTGGGSNPGVVPPNPGTPGTPGTPSTPGDSGDLERPEGLPESGGTSNGSIGGSTGNLSGTTNSGSSQQVSAVDLATGSGNQDGNLHMVDLTSDGSESSDQIVSESDQTGHSAPGVADQPDKVSTSQTNQVGTLPQTGEGDEHASTIGAALLAGLSVLTFGVYRRKRKQ